MKLKERFRKAIFHFFKEEILEFTAPLKPIQYQVSEVKFDMLQYTHDIDLLSSRDSSIDVYEMSVEHMKRELLERVSPYFEVNPIPLTSKEFMFRRRVSVSLFVGKRTIKS